ncbi:T4 family baseplate hub assembly chaperone [Streptomyces sp. NPDC055506]
MITRAVDVLATWESGLGQAPAGRAVLLHRAARPDLGGDQQALLSLPVGEREADLFALRRALFGERMQVRLDCSACGADMEFELDAGEFARTLADRGEPLVRVAEDGWEVEFRVPGVADLTAAARAADPRGVLLARCVVSAVREGEPVSADTLPVAVQRRIAEAAQAADPGADLTLNIACPECGEPTRAELDIASYLWTELDAWARDLLLDVHLLATAYGWSEPEILALSPLRRRYYLELCADV